MAVNRFENVIDAEGIDRRHRDPWWIDGLYNDAYGYFGFDGDMCRHVL